MIESMWISQRKLNLKVVLSWWNGCGVHHCWLWRQLWVDIIVLSAALFTLAPHSGSSRQARKGELSDFPVSPNSDWRVLVQTGRLYQLLLSAYIFQHSEKNQFRILKFWGLLRRGRSGALPEHLCDSTWKLEDVRAWTDSTSLCAGFATGLRFQLSVTVRTLLTKEVQVDDLELVVFGEHCIKIVYRCWCLWAPTFCIFRTEPWIGNTHL